MGQEPKLEEYEFDADKYDEIIIGTPVWASTFTPPIRTFIKENKEKLNGKKFSLFICYSGGGADKAEEKLKEFLGISGFASTLVLVDPLEKKTEEKDKQIELTDEQIIDVIAKESKKRKDSFADYEKSGREDLINQLKKEI